MGSITTLNELFFGAMDRFATRPVALRAKLAGRWVGISYAELLERVHALSIGLRELGVAPGDRVAILSENRPEWAMADFASLAACAIDVPVYPTLPAKQIEYILRDSGAAAIFVSTRLQLEKVQAIRAVLPELRHVVAFDADAQGPGVLALEEVLARGRAARDAHPTWRADALRARPDDVATIIYTSGTTGDPKGVMLTHGNIASNVVGGLEVLPLSERDECLSFLPLSHIFERMAGHYCMVEAGAIINYATSVDTVAAEMGEVRPTIMISVPRLYEKIYARALEAAAAGSSLKRRIFYWAKRVGEARVDAEQAGRRPGAGLRLRNRLADRLVFAKLRARTGGRLGYFCSGGAALNPEIAKFFFAAGLPILEGYGLTETSPVITVNRPGRERIGTVGEPVRGVEVKIAPDGEILTRGPHVMKGYYNKPEATAEAIDADGWFRTGDIGELEGDYLRITDRKKDLIVTAGGKNIAPQPIENMAKTSKFVSNAVMLGDRRKFPIMLVVPNLEPLRAWAHHKQLAFGSDAELLELPETYTKMEREVRKTLRDLAQYETPKKLLLIPRDFTIESGELTPSLKVKRREVETNYRDRIEALYQEAAGGVHDMAHP
ncbi:MAG TPA: long-chain fatty acid--CoA ligase [Gemmatimonadales bacterium]|nr:long-chain fatty acid--CoA ligase [Gemmatimonadales bacterium]